MDNDNKENSNNIIDLKKIKKAKTKEIDSFAESIEEEIRAENLKIFWKKYGSTIVGIIIAIVILAGVHNMWQKKQNEELEAISSKFVVAQNMIMQNKQSEALSALKEISRAGKKEYAFLAKFEHAALLQEEADKKVEVIEIYKTISEDTKVSEVFRNLAYIYYVNAFLDTSADKDLEEMVKNLVSDKFQKGEWHILAKESLAYCYIKMGKKDLAKNTLEALAKTEGIPNNIAERCRIILPGLRQ
ncbi:MAG: tetratricopeptide repeat protein [Holosporales bacterium]|jgi:hypothetical protein|nr:tetratricopeptide repeat protein [Holosporales bacterium]